MTFELPNKCCICFSLKKGGTIIAGLSIVASLVSCVMIIIYLCSDFDAIAKEIADNSNDFERNINENSGSQAMLAVMWLTEVVHVSCIKRCSRLLRKAAKFCAGVLLLLSIVLLLSSILLIKGIQNKSQKQIFPFLAVLALTIVFTSIIAILQFESGPFFATLTLIVIFIYFFICIYSLYKNVDDVDTLPTHGY